MMLASKHCISSVLAQRCQLERAGNRAAVRKRVLGGTGRERKIRLRPALLGLFERKEIVHVTGKTNQLRRERGGRGARRTDTKRKTK